MDAARIYRCAVVSSGRDNGAKNAFGFETIDVHWPFDSNRTIWVKR